MNGPNFSGPEYSPARDHKRLSKQHERIASLMADGRWRSVREIAQATGDPENSVQAQLRHLRKPRFGGYIVTKSARVAGCYRYRVRARTGADPEYQGGKSAKAQAARAEALEDMVMEALQHLDSGGLFDRLVAKSLRARLESL